MAEDLASVNMLITGQVQGVFFRASTLEQAQAFNLTGWVKNLADGSVEIQAEGSRLGLEDLREWCMRGPPAAEIEDVTARFGPYRDEFRTFSIVR